MLPGRAVWNAFDTSSGDSAAKSGPSTSGQSLANMTRQLSARPLTADGTTLTGRPRPRFRENLSSGFLAVFWTFFPFFIYALGPGKPRSNYTYGLMFLALIVREKCRKTNYNYCAFSRLHRCRVYNLLSAHYALGKRLGQVGKARHQVEGSHKTEGTRLVPYVRPSLRGEAAGLPCCCSDASRPPFD